ncbi:MAG: hypothetical protein M3304_07780 [Actinomycetota bacterium]|nr:hypothetical protein [Actinomycetota bacterium]
MLVALLAVATFAAVAPRAAFAVVGTTAASNVPYIEVNNTGDSYARQSTTIGNTVYVGGSFSVVYAPATQQDYTRRRLYAYDEVTGLMSSFAPNFNGTVWGLEHSPDGRYLYAAGSFTTVDGVARKGLAQFDLSTGALTSFDARLDAQARTVNYVGGRLIVGGLFSTVNGVKRVALASVDPNTGALTNYVNAGLAGTVYASSAGPTQVMHSAVNSTGTQMAFSGNFTSVAGVPHWRVFLLDLGTTSTSVSAWNAPILEQPCRSSTIPNYVSGLSFAEDGTWFAIASTGYKNSSGPLTDTVCDAVARFSTAPNRNTAATWVNYTGCDSLYSVLVSATAVYVGGHNRWLDNPNACDTAGTGSVSRPGIGAVDRETGKALAWNPTRSRGRGADFLQMTSRGLMVLSDCAASGISGDPSSGANYLAKTFHPCAGLLPGS